MRPRDIIGKRIKELRQAQGLTLRGLAERMQEVGGEPVHASALQRIEKADAGRGVTVEEWLALAVALGVPPLALLTTRTDAEADPVRVTAKVTEPMERFRGWVLPDNAPGWSMSWLHIGPYRAPTTDVDNGTSEEQRLAARRGDKGGK